MLSELDVHCSANVLIRELENTLSRKETWHLVDFAWAQ